MTIAVDPLIAGANGSLVFNTGWRGAWHSATILGGPFMKFNARNGNYFGLCLREEKPEYTNWWLPIRDFSIPHNDTEVQEAIAEVLQSALFDRVPVYVGCTGGWGRTGLFLALLAKTLGYPDPIQYVRDNYTPRAVETEQQERYVEDFDVTDLRKWLLKKSWSRRLFGGK